MNDASQPVGGAGVVEELAHRMCWRYKHSSDPAHSHTYTFNRYTLLEFSDALLEKQRKWAQEAEARAIAAEYAEGQRVLAERERCAAVAESWATDETATTCANVAEAIRGPNVGAKAPT